MREKHSAVVKPVRCFPGNLQLHSCFCQWSSDLSFKEEEFVSSHLVRCLVLSAQGRYEVTVAAVEISEDYALNMKYCGYLSILRRKESVLHSHAG